MLLSDEWDEERDDERAVLVGGKRRSLDKHGSAMSGMTVAPTDGVDEGAAKPKESSGWMRVRTRAGDV